MADYTLTDGDIQLTGDVRNLVRCHPDTFRDAGAWLDRQYSFEKCWKRDQEFYRANNALDRFDADLWQSKNVRLRVAIAELLEVARANDILLPTVNTAYRVLLICWLLTDPQTNQYKPKLTEFQNWSIGSLPHDLMHICSDAIVSDLERWMALCHKAWQVVRPEALTQQVEAKLPASSNPPLPLVDDEARLSPAELADRYAVPKDALRQRLDEWRKKHHEGWYEVTDRKPREAQYIYRVGSVRHIIEQMQATSQLTGE